MTIVSLDANGDTVGQGSGFFVRSNGVIVTNWHVMQGASQAVVIRHNGERFERVMYLDGDEDSDIALLKVPGYALPVLEPRAESPAVGERVVAIGSPLGLSRTVTEGIVSASRMVDGRELIQMTAAISPGSSGGAVLDENGRVFAISTLYMQGGQQLNFAVPIRYALGLIPSTMVARPLSEVFAGDTRGSNASATGLNTQSSRRSASQPPAPPARTRDPQVPLNGAFYVEGHWYSPDLSEPATQLGFLFVKDRVGLLILAFELEDGTLDSTRIGFVETWHATEDGQVAMAIGDVEFGGYQTEDGFFVSSIYGQEPRFDIQLEAQPISYPISRNDGLYQVRITTKYITKSGETLEYGLEWQGDMAIGFRAGNACVDLFVENESGGNQNLAGCAPIADDGTFTVKRERDGGGSVTLTAYARAGVLRGKWIDRRSGGTRFEGTIEATRR